MGTWDTWSEVKNMQYKKGFGDLEESAAQGTIKREFEDLIENSMPPIYKGLEHVSQLVGNLANRIYDLTEKLEEGCTCGGDCTNERPEPTPMDEAEMREEALHQAKLALGGEVARRERERCHDELVRKYEMLRREEELVRKAKMVDRETDKYGSFPY